MTDPTIVEFLRNQCIKVLRKNQVGYFKVLFENLVKYNCKNCKNSNVYDELSSIGVSLNDLESFQAYDVIAYLKKTYPDYFMDCSEK